MGAHRAEGLADELREELVRDGAARRGAKQPRQARVHLVLRHLESDLVERTDERAPAKASGRGSAFFASRVKSMLTSSADIT